MEEQDRKRIEELVGKMDCPYDFLCAEGGLEELCKIEDIGDEKYLRCAEEHPGRCFQALKSNGDYLCTCELRISIARELGK